MKYLVFYDITEPRRLRRMAKRCEDYGHRLQKSVFLCDLDGEQFARMWSRLTELLKEEDSLLAWPVCAACAARTQMAGIGSLPSEDLALVV